MFIVADLVSLSVNKYAFYQNLTHFWHDAIQLYNKRGSKGETGCPDPPPPPPLKNHKHIGFLSNTGPDPLKNHIATKPAYNVGPSSAREMAFRWRADNSLLIVVSLPSSAQKNDVKVEPHLIKLSGSAHI